MVAAASIGMHAESIDLWRRVAAGVMPRVKVRPSAWAEKHVRLSREISPDKPGAYRCGHKPWLRAVHDVLWDNPTKAGVVIPKRAQAGITQATLNIIAATCDQDPQPVMCAISDKANAEFFANEGFKPRVTAIPRLAESMREAVEDDERKTLAASFAFVNGRVDFVGGGSAGGMASRTYLTVILDELEVIYDNFPREAGDPWVFAQARTLAFPHRARFYVFSHPRRDDFGIWKIFTDESDQGAWCFDCPHCHRVVRPKWSNVRFADRVVTNPLEAFGEVDAASARFHCPQCDHPISDHERALAVWEPSAEHPKGTARREPGVSDAIAAQRRLVGFQIHGLVDPDASLLDMARKWLACTDEKSVRTFLNTDQGEPKREESRVVSVDMVRERVQVSETIRLPGGHDGVQLITMGVDVQAPEANPTLYSVVTAWTAAKHCFALDFVKLSGWGAMAEYLRVKSWELLNPLTGEVTRHGVGFAAFDCGAWTSQVLDFCRLGVWSSVTTAQVQLVPMRFQAHVKSTTPAVLSKESRRIDPQRPHLGLIDIWDLHRNTWVARSMDLWESKAITILCPPPADLANHATANRQVPAPDIHNWGNPELVWEKEKGRRDDWQMGLTYAQATAVISGKLDQLYLQTHHAQQGAQQGAAASDQTRADVQKRGSWVTRGRRAGGWWN